MTYENRVHTLESAGVHTLECAGYVHIAHLEVRYAHGKRVRYAPCEVHTALYVMQG